jgi:two-component system response regulator YesN
LYYYSNYMGLIGLEINLDYLKKYIYSDIHDDHYINLLYSSDGDLIFSRNTELYSEIADITQNPVISDIIHTDNQTGSFFAKDSKNNSFLYTYYKNSRGRIHILAIPRAMIVKYSNWNVSFIALSFFMFLICGSVFVVLSSRRVYNPILNLVKYSNNISNGTINTENKNEVSIINECLEYLRGQVDILNDFINEVKPTLLEKFFHRILNCEYINYPEKLKKDCKKYSIQENCLYNIVVAHIENIHNDKLSGMEKPISMLSIIEIMRNKIYSSNILDGYVFTYQNNIVSVMYCDEAFSEKSFIKAIKEYLNNVLGTVNSTFNSSIFTFGVGRIISNIFDLSISYSEALKALQYRLYKNLGRILYIDDIEVPKKKNILFYPSHIEQKILASLQEEDMQKVEEAFKEFVNAICESESYNFIYQSYQILLSSIILAFQNNGGNVQEMMENDPYGQLVERKTYLEIYYWFTKDLFPLYVELMQDMHNEASKSIILNITKYINDNITSDISLIKCADMVNLSPAYMSRIFKKYMGVTFVDYVVKCKVDEIKRLLVETDYSIEDIADIMGYSKRSIYRLFKRITNMSPNNYRSQNKN